MEDALASLLLDGTLARGRSIPLVGRVTAGQPILAIENIEDYLMLPQSLVGLDELFCLRVQGESMIGTGIFDGDILVVPKSSNRLLPILKRARAIVVEEEGVTTPAAIVGLTLDIPVLTGATGATGILKSGTTVTVDPTRGFVYSGITNAM